MSVLARPTVCSPALVLRAWDCGETSAIASLLTREHGYVKVIAKAARQPRSRLRPLVEPGRLITAEFGLDPARELQYLRGGSVDLDPLGPGSTLERSAFLLGALELVDRCRPREAAGGLQQTPATAAAGLFVVCEEFIRVLSSPACTQPDLVFFGLEWQLLARHGLAPAVAACVGCGRSLAEADAHPLGFSPGEGGALCPRCLAADAGAARPLTAQALEVLQELDRRGCGRGDGPPLARASRRQVGALLHAFLGYHLPGYRLPAALELLRLERTNRP